MGDDHRNRGIPVFVEKSGESVVSVDIQAYQGAGVGDRFGQRPEGPGAGHATPSTAALRND